MTPLKLSLTRLLGKKELTFGCIVKVQCAKTKHYSTSIVIEPEEDGDGLIRVLDGFFTIGLNDYKIIGHPPTLSDFHRWMMGVKDTSGNSRLSFRQNKESIVVWTLGEAYPQEIDYDSSFDFLDQSEETLKAILNLIESNDTNG